MQSTLKRSAGTIAALLILFFTSCSHDDISAPNTGEVMVTFSFSLPDNASAMRALNANEDKAIKTVEVLAFDKDGKFSYASYATPESGKNSVTVSLVKSTDSDDKYDLVVLANSRLEVMAAAQQFTKGTTTKADALAALTRTVEGKWRAMDGGAKDFLHISSDPEDASLKGLEIKESSSFSSVNLYRALALVNVELNTTAQGTFQLTSVRVYNRNKQGNLIGGRDGSNIYTKAPNAIDSREATPLVYGSDTGTQTSEIKDDKSCSNEIFLFEVDQTGLTDDTRPCIVIGGLYNSSSTPTYYRADFHNGTNYLDILRNHNYTFTITGVNIHGFPTPQDAFDAREVNIEYTVVAWVDAPLDTDYAKQPSLVPSSAKFTFDAAARDKNNGDNILTIETDHSAGWTAEIIDGSGWLSLIMMDGTTINPSDLQTATNIKLKLTANATGAPRSAIIKLTAGGSTYSVRVEQSEVVNSDKLYPSEASEYTMRPFGHKIFIPVSAANAGGTIKLNAADVFDVEFATTAFNPATSPAPVIKTAKVVGVGSSAHIYVESGNGLGTGTVSIKKTGEAGAIHTWTIKVEPEPEANSYIVQPGQTIYIPVSQAYRAADAGQAPADAVLPSGWFDNGNFQAELVWTDNSRGISSTSNIASFAVMGTGSSACLVITTGSSHGNAVVGIRKKNASGQAEGGFLWSWHIWVIPDNPWKSTASGQFMDRNLGALNNGFVGGQTGGELLSDRTGSIGLHYQWGRKDPFPGPLNFSGDEWSNLYFGQSVYSRSGSSQTGQIKTLNINSGGISSSTYSPSPNTLTTNLGYAVSNPHIFYCGPSDWFIGSGSCNDNLWGSDSGSKTVYDPCPPGWRVPNTSLWLPALNNFSGWNQAYSGKGWVWNSNGCTVSVVADGWVGSQIAGTFFPAAGYRGSSNGVLSLVGSDGYCWAASPSNSSGRTLVFGDASLISSGSSLSNSSRAYGHSVRCSKE